MIFASLPNVLGLPPVILVSSLEPKEIMQSAFCTQKLAALDPYTPM